MDATGVNPTSVASIIDLPQPPVPAPAAAVQQSLFNAPSRNAVRATSPHSLPQSPLSSARSPLDLTHPVSCAVSQALDCEALKILLQPLIAHPRSDATISDLVKSDLVNGVFLKLKKLRYALRWRGILL